MLYGFITTKHKQPNNVSSASILDENLLFFMHSALGFVSKSNDMFNNRNKNKEEPGVHFRLRTCIPCGQNLSGTEMLGSFHGVVHGEEVPILSRRTDLVKLPSK